MASKRRIKFEEEHARREAFDEHLSTKDKRRWSILCRHRKDTKYRAAWQEARKQREADAKRKRMENPGVPVIRMNEHLDNVRDVNVTCFWLLLILATFVGGLLFMLSRRPPPC